MKKLATLTLTTILSLPVLSHETKIGVIEDTFFNKPGVTVTLRTLVRDGISLKAVVDATHQVTDINTPPNPEKRTLIVIPFVERYWHHDDKKRFSQEMIRATVICGEHTLVSIYEVPNLVYYDLLTSKHNSKRKIKTYVRADDSHYIHKGNKKSRQNSPKKENVASVDNEEHYIGYGKPRFNMVRG